MANNKGLCSCCRTIMREYWIKLHLEKAMPITQLAKLSGFHQDTLYLWKVKYLKDGIAGLQDKSKAPHYHPNQYSETIKESIILIRKQGLEYEKRYLGPKIIALRLQKRFGIVISPAGIGKFLNKAGLIPEQRQRRVPKKIRVKTCKIFHPGELVQMDIKYAVKSTGNNWFYQYSAIDYYTGIAYGLIYELTSNFESILFLQSLRRFYPFKIIGVQTDNDTVFTNYYTGYRKSANPMRPRLHPFDVFCKELGVTHYLISPGKPAQNGKVERFHRTCEEEFYQRTAAKDLNSLRKQFRDYLYYYNNEREHLGLGGLTPLERLKTIPEYDKIKVLMP
jgi:transposase InsO family protein